MRYLNDPVGWAESHGIELWSKQREILDSLRDNVYTAVASCYDIGKSYTAGLSVCWWGDVHETGTAQAVTTAPTGDQVKGILWKEIRTIHGKLGLKGRVNLKEWYDNDQYGIEQLIALGRKPADNAGVAFQGRHAPNMLIVLDEAAGVSEDLYDAAEGLLTAQGNVGGKARILAIGNPWSPTHRFGKICQSGSGWNFIRVPYNVTPNFTDEPVSPGLKLNFVSRQWVEDRKRDWGEQDPRYQSKVLAIFPPAAENTLFNPSWIEGAFNKDQRPTKPKQIGVDVADEGTDSSVIWLRNGRVARLEWRQASAGVMATAAATYEIWGENQDCDTVKVDSAPPGVVRRLQQLDEMIPAVSINPTKPMDKEKFVNRRAELYWNLRERFRTASIDLDGDAPYRSELEKQLLSIRWWVNRQGQIVIEPKDKLRSRGEQSPDLVDGLVMCFAPVVLLNDPAPAQRQTVDPLHT